MEDMILSLKNNAFFSSFLSSENNKKCQELVNALLLSFLIIEEVTDKIGNRSLLL